LIKGEIIPFMRDRTVRGGDIEAEADPVNEESSVGCMLLIVPSPCDSGAPQFQNEGKKVWRSEGGG
jgi:hypothetical protein